MHSEQPKEHYIDGGIKVCIGVDCVICREKEKSKSSAGLIDYTADQQVDQLAILVNKLSHSLKKCNKASTLPDRAMDYLKCYNLVNSPLR